MLAAARTLRFTNRAGTDVTYRIGYPVKAQYGYVDRPGQWDHWPSGGMVLTCGEDDGIDGRVVVDRGDILLPFKQYVQEPIEFAIEAGRITDIRGDGYQAELVRQYMTDFDDPDAYGLSHIGWGLDERAKWAALATDSRGHGMELRAFCGNVLFSTGPERPRRRAESHELPPRHPDAQLQPLVRRPARDRRRRGRHRRDAARPLAGRRLSRRVPLPASTEPSSRSSS